MHTIMFLVSLFIMFIILIIFIIIDLFFFHIDDLFFKLVILFVGPLICFIIYGISYLTINRFTQKSRLYSKKIADFAKKNNFKFFWPKIDLFKSVYQEGGQISFENIVFYYKHTDFLDKKLEEMKTYKKFLFFPFVKNSAKYKDYYFYNFMEGDYKRRKVQIYNYQLVLVGTVYPSTYCEVFLNKNFNNHLYLEEESFRPSFLFIKDVDWKDVELEYHNFNKKYRVESDISQFAFEVLDPTLMEELMKYKDIAIMISKNSLIVAQLKELQPDQILKNLNLGIKIADKIDRK